MDEASKDFAPLDPGRVNPLDPVEMRYWCAELGCDLEQLNAAVKRVGEHVTEVRKEIARAGAAKTRAS
jgi:hypothetical protein